MIPGFFGDLGRHAIMSGITLGKVVDVHPEQNTIDVRCATDARKLVSVPVVGMGNSGNTGLVDLPVPDLTTPRVDPPKWESFHVEGGRRDMVAVIAFADGAPVCLGFVLPPDTQMTFPKELGEERRINRHSSDVYETIDRDGNAEWYHPSGTHILVGENPEHLDLTKKDWDKLWEIKRNLKRVVHFVLSLWNGAEEKEKARVHIKPDGDAYVRAEKRVYVCVGPAGEAVKVEFADAGTARVTAQTSVTVIAPLVKVEADEVQIEAGDMTVTAGKVEVDAGAVDLNGIVKINGIIQQGN